MQRQRGAEKVALFRPLPHPSEPGKGSVSDRRSPGVGPSGRLSTLSLTVSLPDVFLNVSLNVSETDAERAARQKRHGLGKGGAVKCGKERQDAAVGAEIATVNSCGDQRGVSELRIGTNNRREGDCEKNYAGGVHGNRRGDLRGVSAQRIAREFASGICVRNLRQEFASGDWH